MQRDISLPNAIYQLTGLLRSLAASHILFFLSRPDVRVWHTGPKGHRAWRGSDCTSSPSPRQPANPLACSHSTSPHSGSLASRAEFDRQLCSGAQLHFCSVFGPWTLPGQGSMALYGPVRSIWRVIGSGTTDCRRPCFFFSCRISTCHGTNERPGLYREIGSADGQPPPSVNLLRRTIGRLRPALSRLANQEVLAFSIHKCQPAGRDLLFLSCWI